MAREATCRKCGQAGNGSRSICTCALVIRAGRIVGFLERGRRVDVTFQERGPRGKKQMAQVERVINATGPEMNFRTESFDFPQKEQRRCLSLDMEPRHDGGEGCRKGGPRHPERQVSFLPSVWGTRSFRGVNTLSIRPYALASSALMNRSRSMSRSIVSIGWPVWWL